MMIVSMKEVLQLAVYSGIFNIPISLLQCIFIYVTFFSRERSKCVTGHLFFFAQSQKKMLKNDTLPVWLLMSPIIVINKAQADTYAHARQSGHFATGR